MVGRTAPPVARPSRTIQAKGSALRPRRAKPAGVPHFPLASLGRALRARRMDLRSILAEELLDVARCDRHAAGLPPAEDRERYGVAGAMRPEELIERAAVPDVRAVDGEDDVTRLEPGLLARTARQQPGDHDVVLHRVAEDPEPRPLAGGLWPAGQEGVARVEEVVRGDREGEAADLVQVE